MQIQIFTVSVFDSGGALEEMNKFLRGQKVLEVHQELYSNPSGAYWCYSVKYIVGQPSSSLVYSKGRKEKVDYKVVLDDKTFEVFSQLRVFRKEIANKEAIPAYAIFTDAELAELSKLKELNLKSILSVKGIGKNKAEKYGQRILDMYQQNQKQDEKSG